MQPVLKGIFNYANLNSLRVHKERGRLLLLILLSLFWINGFSQNAYTFFESYQPFELNAKGKLDFVFDNATFFKNNEYKGNIADGYTLTGAWIRPKLAY